MTGSPPTPSTDGGRAGARQWTALAVLALPTMLLALDVSVLYLALPHLSADLGASSVEQLWITDIFGFMIAGFLVTMGTLGDRIGRRRLLILGAAAFGVCSLLAAYAATPLALIALRALLGVAGATLMPSTLSLISATFVDPRQRTTAIGVWMTAFLAGAALGPLIGGALLEHFWWGSVFLIAVPAMLVLIATAPSLLPADRDTTAGRVDPASVALSLASVLPVVYGVKELAGHGPSGPPILAVVVGLAAGVAFLRRQRTLTDPIVDPRLFTARGFGPTLIILLLTAATVGGVTLLFAQYLQILHGLSPLRAGLWMLPHTTAMIVGCALVPSIAARGRPGPVIAVGLGISTAGYLLLTQVHPADGPTLAVTAMTLVYLGLAPGAVLGTTLVVTAAPPERAGAASSLSETSTELGLALGVALLGSVAAAAYHARMAAVPATDAAARDTFAAGAGHPGDAVRTAAEHAFTTGLTAAAAVSAATTAVLVVLALARLRPARRTAAADSGAAPR